MLTNLKKTGRPQKNGSTQENGHLLPPQEFFPMTYIKGVFAVSTPFLKVEIPILLYRIPLAVSSKVPL
jgi:hypothetical protein